MKIMYLKHAKLIAALVVVINLLLVYYCWKSMLWKTIAPSVQLGVEQQLALQQIGDMGLSNLAATGVKTPREKLKNAYKHLRKSITVIFRNAYHYENDLLASIDSILEVVPKMPILVLYESLPYPPLAYDHNNTEQGLDTTVRFMSLAFDVTKTPAAQNPLLTIRTKYALFLPDSVRLSSKGLLQKTLREMNSKYLKEPYGAETTNKHMLMIPFASNVKTFACCAQIHLDLTNWTIEYGAVNSSSKCDLYLQKHGILLDVGVLLQMPAPLESPFPEFFYIQAKLAKLDKSIFPQAFQDGRHLFASFHTIQRRLETRRRQFREMYKKLLIKRIIRRAHKMNTHSKVDIRHDGMGNTGLGGAVAAAALTLGAAVSAGTTQHNFVLDPQFSSSNFSLPRVTEIDLIGCDRNTKSCIGSVYNNLPFYVHLGKHTPPCCLDKLRITFAHVMEEFENVGIRYWLDNLALKSAIETNQLALDAYEIDISFNVFDLERSNALKMSQTKPHVDNDGFYWIKATDGHYFRVQFSKQNQVGVNLLPFEVIGNEVRPSGFFGWKAKEFTLDFLHPMSTVLFSGKHVMCPNNVREFLDFKNLP